MVFMESWFLMGHWFYGIIVLRSHTFYGVMAFKGLYGVIYERAIGFMGSWF